MSPEGDCICVFWQRVLTFYMLTVGSWLKQDAAGVGLFLLLKERSHLVDVTTGTCGGQARHAQKLHWLCEHPKMHLWHHRHPAVARMVPMGFLLLLFCCSALKKNPDVAPDRGPECPTASKASKACPPSPLARGNLISPWRWSSFPSQSSQLWLLAWLGCQLLPYIKLHMQASKQWPAPELGGSIYKAFDWTTPGTGFSCCSWVSGRTRRGQTCCSSEHTSEEYFDRTR